MQIKKLSTTDSQQITNLTIYIPWSNHSSTLHLLCSTSNASRNIHIRNLRFEGDSTYEKLFNML